MRNLSQTDRWRAGCIERCKSGSERGMEKRASKATRSVPTLLEVRGSLA